MWFEGPIDQAVAKSKADKRLLIVFIHGNDENSKRVLEYWNDPYVQNLVTENSCVALKLTEGSGPAKQFAMIYPVVNIPVSYIITPKGGVPLEVIIQYESVDDFKTRLSKTVNAFVESMRDNAGTQAPASASFEYFGTSPPPLDPPATNDNENTENRNNAGPSGNLDDRLQRAQALIAERQKQKAREAEEKAREEELNRRQEGREFQKVQERIKEQEALQIAQEQKKQKKDDKEYLQKLRDQIAADRAEKASKYSNVQNEQKRQVEEKKKEKTEAEERQQQLEEEQRKRFALIQFRLPDGSALRHQFDGGDAFAQAYAWISEHARLGANSFILVQMIPRREFTSQDGTRTMLDLGLTPNATLMVLPNSPGSFRGPTQAHGGMMNWIWSMIAVSVTTPLSYVYNFLYSMFFGPAGNPPPVTGTNSSTTPANRSQQPSTSANTGSAGGSQGNITRFRNSEDKEKKKDDDNATWNGNSTQQL